MLLVNKRVGVSWRESHVTEVFAYFVTRYLSLVLGRRDISILSWMSRRGEDQVE